MNKAQKRRAALVYHAKPSAGKIKVVPTKKYATQRDLSLAYSPGVAEPCLEIAKDKENVYKYTSKGNLVAVISNGSAVLGLGNIGPEAGKPVMEGKGLLFKIFADIDVFDIEVDKTDVEGFVETVKAIAPTFGGINLEDIKAPEAFEIERRLKEELDIPVMHDDQHGTAIISAAALINALEIAKKKIEKVRIVVNGAGAAAISCTLLYICLGAKKQNIIMCDSKGVIRKDRENLSKEKVQFATDKDYYTLEEAMIHSDVFIGLSKADVVTPKMLLSMRKNPIVFAMANPNPEIDYETAIRTRKDIIMATGRSDHPNQVNNVLGFPFIFRGALDVRSTEISETMKLAAVKAIASLAKKNVPEQVNVVYEQTSLSFGRDYIIPKPFDPRLIYEIPPAVAKAAMDSGIAKNPITDWEKYRNELMERLGSSSKKIIRILHSRAKATPKKLIFAEADHLDVLKAAQIVYDEKIARPILLGDKQIIEELKQEIDFSEPVPIIDPKKDNENERRKQFAFKFWDKNKRKGITLLEAEKLMRERNHFGAAMVNEGQADAMITGYSRRYSSILKPLFKSIGIREGVDRIAASNVMLTKKGAIFLSDTTININPTAEQLESITKMTCKLVKMFGIEPKVALLSFTNFDSSSKTCEKITKVVKNIHTEYPELIADGPIQADFALNNELLNKNFSFSKLLDQKTNVFIFPNLDSANISYKMMKELYEADSIGPILMGLKKPVHILQLGASVDEMVNMAAVAVIDAQYKSSEE